MKDSTQRMLIQIKPALLPLAAVLAVLSLWLAWNGITQMRYASKRSGLEAVQKRGAQGMQKVLQAQHKQLGIALAEGSVRRALEAGDLDLANRSFGEDWPDLEKAMILPPDLRDIYDTLPKGGVGRLAVMQMALSENRAVNVVVRDGGKPRLALAAPVRAGQQLVGVAYARLPLETLTAPLNELNPGADGYLALRQGTITLWERGVAEHAPGAERMPVAIDGSAMRLLAATSAPPAAAFGLPAMSALLSAVLGGGLVFLFWRLSRMRLAATGNADESPTLDAAVAAEQAATAAPAAAAPVKVKQTPKPAPVMIDKSIFRAYDIRGVVGQTLDPGVAELIGHSIGSLMHEKGLRDIVVGRDGRLSGPELVQGLTAGLRKAGIGVIDIGLVPTPVTYYGAYQLRTGSCVSVTGSHNPPDYNGFKIVVGGETLSGDAILDLYARIAENRLHTATIPGGHGERDVAEDYVQRIAQDIQLGRQIRVVVDAGNGAAGEIGPRVLEAIGAEVEELYCEIDGNFPNHHPDPSEPHNLDDLIQMVQRRDADLGIAFDGDGDRLGVVTRAGDNIFPDRLLMLFASDVLERNPGAVIVYDVKCTGRLSGHILRAGGSPLMWKTGHSLIKAKMRETGAELAGEMSGHFFFAERWYGFDDGIYAAARLLEILSMRDESAADVLNALPKGISTPEIKVDAPGGNPHAFVDAFVEATAFDNARLSTIDGLRVDWADGWGLIRASNTTPVLVLRFEADNTDALHRIQNAFRDRMLAVKPDMKLPF